MISAESIAEVRDRTDIVAVLSEYIPSLKRRGRSLVGLCPFHKEKTPSFHVNQERGFFHCFGCKESGSVIDFVMKHDGYTFPEAVRVLAERAGIPLDEETKARPEVDRGKKQKDDLYALNNLAASFFEAQLREHPNRDFAWNELARRGLDPSNEVIQSFRLGYAPPAWDGLAQFLKAQGVSPVLGETSGLLVPRTSGSGHYDRFRHRLMFTVTDPQGRVVAFSGRALPALPDAEDRGDPPPKYINSPESPIYTKGAMLFGLYQARHAIRQSESAVMVEGNFDVVSLHANGIANVVAPLGTAFTEDQAKLLKRYTATVVLLFDGDAAGRKATRLAEAPCAVAGIEARVAALPDGRDPDDLVREKGPEGLEDVLAAAEGMLEYLLELELDESFNAADAFERAARVNRVATLLARQTDPIVRSMAKSYADQLAGRLDLVRSPETFRALEQSVRKALAVAEQAIPEGADPKRARMSSRTPGVAERREIVGALIEWPELLDDAEVKGVLELLEGVSVSVVTALKRSMRRGPAGEKMLDSGVFLAQIDSAIQAFASERLADPHHESPTDAQATVIENASRLRNLLQTRETQNNAREQSKAAGDWEAVVELGKEALERERLRQGLTK